MNNVGEIIPPGEGTLPLQPAHHGLQPVDQHAENTADEAQLQEEINKLDTAGGTTESRTRSDLQPGNTQSSTQPAEYSQGNTARTQTQRNSPSSEHSESQEESSSTSQPKQEENKLKRDRGTRSTSAGATKTREETTPARRGTQAQDHTSAERNMGRNWNDITKTEETNIVSQEVANSGTELSVEGLPERIYTAIAIQLGRITAEAPGDTQQLPAQDEIATLLQG